MSIAAASRIRNEMCFIQICVDDYDNGEIGGRLYNAYYVDAIHYDNWVELIKLMEAIFDKFNYPHKTLDLRTFEDEPEPSARRIKAAPTVTLRKHKPKGKIATFNTRVMFRQNASWQGFVKWLEEDLQEDFSSMLEFSMLVSSALEDFSEI